MAMRTNLVLSFLIVSLPIGLGSDAGLAFPHTEFGASFMNEAMQKLEEPASAQAMLDDLETKVMQFIVQRDNNDTSTADGFLKELSTASTQVSALHAAVEAPDLVWDNCLLAENASLHDWKVCNNTHGTHKTSRDKECAEKVALGVGSYTIDKYNGVAPNYNPTLRCNFETFKLDGYDIACNAFVGDIVAQAKDEFKTDMDSYNTEKAECNAAITTVTNTANDCSQKGTDYFAKEAECGGKETTRILKICAFQTKLESKCSTLGLLDTELTDLEDREESRNKEFRAVMRLKCLFTRYTNNDKCFDTAADTACDLAIDGASKDYGSRAAQELHGFRTQRDTNNKVGGFSCAVNSLTFGNTVRYEKLDANDDYSYYTTVDPVTYTTDEAGVLSPSVCG